MPPLCELRYDRLTLSPRPRFDRSAGARDPFHPRDLLPGPLSVFPAEAKDGLLPMGDDAAAGATATSEYGDDYPDEVPPVTPGDDGILEECSSDDDAQEDDEDEDETAAYVVGSDSICFLPPVDDGSLVVLDRGLQVHVPSPWPWSYWSSKPEPWQIFYLERGAGWHVRSEKELNEELWITFLLNRGEGMHSRWWMDLQRAFASSSSAGPALKDPTVPPSAAASVLPRMIVTIPRPATQSLHRTSSP